jgi:hypothetical protein
MSNTFQLKKIFKSKMVIFLLAAVALTVFMRNVNQTSLTQSAIIVGLSLDRKENEFEVAAQSVVVSGSSANGTATINYLTLKETGKTVGEAIDKLGQRFGLVPSLSHCMVLFITPSIIKLDTDLILYPLTHSLGMPEQAIIVTCEKEPDKLLSKRIGSTVSTAFYLQYAFLQEEASDGIIRVTIKDFLAKTASRSHALALPYLIPQEVKDSPINDQDKIDEAYELITDQLLVGNRENQYLLDVRVSKAVAIYMSDIVKGNISTVLDSGEIFEFTIIDKSMKQKVKGKTLTTEMELVVNFIEAQNIDIDSPLSNEDEFVDRAAKNLEKDLREELTDAFKIAQEQKIDFLQVEAHVYQKYGRTLEKDCFDQLNFIPSIKVKVRETS